MTEALKPTPSNKTCELNKACLLLFNYCDEPIYLFFYVTVINVTGLLYKYFILQIFKIESKFLYKNNEQRF